VTEEVVDSLKILASPSPARVEELFTLIGYKYAPDLAAECTNCFALSKSSTLLLVSLVTVLHGRQTHATSLALALALSRVLDISRYLCVVLRKLKREEKVSCKALYVSLKIVVNQGCLFIDGSGSIHKSTVVIAGFPPASAHKALSSPSSPLSDLDTSRSDS
jgi:hypothetical protein